ncbi:MAG TPA: hypothetical protein DCM86_06850 [Verrucomicrobiales bacterium]|nr:hypothetical protein [Verrucomicrobiales bacterium]
MMPHPLRLNRTHPLLRCGLAALCLAFLAGQVGAQLPVARLDTIFPPGGKAGQEVEVTLGGAELDDLAGIRFSREGLTARPVTGNRVVIKIDPGVPPGTYEARAWGRFGISNPRAFCVGDLPESVEPQTNGLPSTAAPIAPGSCVNGKATPAKSDYFRFAAKQGERWFIECQAAEIDSRMEPSVWVLSDAGRELAHTRRGGLIDFTAPSDATYLIRVHDFLNQGGEDYFYRLMLSRRPHIDSIRPLLARPGTNQTFTLVGRNLPGGTPVPGLKPGGIALEELTVQIDVPGDELSRVSLQTSRRVRPNGGSADGFDFVLPSTNGVSNPVFLTFASTGTPLLEQEPNDDAAHARKLSPPVEVSGGFQSRGDMDLYTFEARKGEVWQIDLLSQRLGFPTDPALTLQRVTRGPKGEEQASDVAEVTDGEGSLGGLEFKSASGDVALRFDVKEEGTYRLAVRDQAAVPREETPRGYILRIRAPQPDFRLAAMPVATPPAAKDSKEVRLGMSLLRAGGTTAFRVYAYRLEGLDSDIELQVEGLPPGVTSPGAHIPAGASTALLLLQAEEHLATWTGPVRILGKATAPQGAKLLREARGATLLWGTGNYETDGPQSRMTRGLALGVLGEDPTPLRMAPADPKPFEATVGGKLTIPIQLTRNAEFPGPTKLRLLGHPALGTGKELDVDKGATNGVFEVDLSAIKIPEGEHLLHIETQTGLQAPRSPSALRAAEESVKGAEAKLVSLRQAVDKAKAAAAESAKGLEKAEADAKSAPDKTDDLKRARDAKTAADKELATASAQVAETESARAAAQERIKQNAKRDYNELFYSAPLRVRIAAAKPPEKPKS